MYKAQDGGEKTSGEEDLRKVLSHTPTLSIDHIKELSLRSCVECHVYSAGQYR